VWSSASNANLGDYKGRIVQWNGDTAAQKTSWQVGYDGNRRIIHDLSTFQCLHDAGAGNSLTVSSEILDKLPDQTGVWATCGSDRIGPNGTLEQGSHLKSGNYTLTLTPKDLVLTSNGSQIWSTSHAGTELNLQTDGNLVEYDEYRNPVWATNTKDLKPGYLVLGSDGSLGLYDAFGGEIWSR